jgi:hypothetical protein
MGLRPGSAWRLGLGIAMTPLGVVSAVWSGFLGVEGSGAGIWPMAVSLGVFSAAQVALHADSHVSRQILKSLLPPPPAAVGSLSATRRAIRPIVSIAPAPMGRGVRGVGLRVVGRL